MIGAVVVAWSDEFGVATYPFATLSCLRAQSLNPSVDLRERGSDSSASPPSAELGLD